LAVCNTKFIYVTARSAPDWTNDSPFIVKIGKGRKNTILKDNYEGRVKSPTRGAPSGHIHKLTSNGPENMTKMGRSGKRF
jgi:hypothetical protein